jgi:hypothetical protein
MNHVKPAKWVVHAKIESALREPAAFEICVLRDDNILGKRSYGWFDEKKLLISHNGGPCPWPLTQKVLTKLLAVAAEVADELNQEESQ